MGRIAKKTMPGTSEAGRETPIWLFENHVFGRDPRCATVLRSDAVSRFHARIAWAGREWTLRDMGSRNGTYLNGRRLSDGEARAVANDDKICLGDFQEEYFVLDTAAPRTLLVVRDATGASRLVELATLHPLPSAERPLYTLFLDDENGAMLERDGGEIAQLEHGATFGIDGVEYQVVLRRQPGGSSWTATSVLEPEADRVHLEIAVSPDEESAEIVLRHGARRHALAPKAHFYLLAYLARCHRAALDPSALEARESDADDLGWVDCEVVCRQLRINREHLAQQVFRIRQELKSCMPSLADKIIDRRRRGKMRIGACASIELRSMD
jgi:hypothetical protein